MNNNNKDDHCSQLIGTSATWTWKSPVLQAGHPDSGSNLQTKQAVKQRKIQKTHRRINAWHLPCYTSTSHRSLHAAHTRMHKYPDRSMHICRPRDCQIATCPKCGWHRSTYQRLQGALCNFRKPISMHISISMQLGIPQPLKNQTPNPKEDGSRILRLCSHVLVQSCPGPDYCSTHLPTQSHTQPSHNYLHAHSCFCLQDTRTNWSVCTEHYSTVQREVKRKTQLCVHVL